MRLFGLGATLVAVVLSLAACSGGEEGEERSELDPAENDHKVAVMDDRFDDATLATLLDEFPDCLATDSILVRSPTTDEVVRSAERGLAASATIGVDCQSDDAPPRTIIAGCQRGEWVANDGGAWMDVGTSC